jgi:hypothetical protein
VSKGQRLLAIAGTQDVCLPVIRDLHDMCRQTKVMIRISGKATETGDAPASTSEYSSETHASASTSCLFLFKSTPHLTTTSQFETPRTRKGRVIDILLRLCRLPAAYLHFLMQTLCGEREATKKATAPVCAACSSVSWTSALESLGRQFKGPT